MTQFFNTAVLLLLVNANFSEMKVPYLNQAFTGQYTDFTSDWYGDVGVILIKALLIGAFMPIIEFFIAYGMKEGLRKKDRSFT